MKDHGRRSLGRALTTLIGAASLAIVPAAGGQPAPVWTSAGNLEQRLAVKTLIGTMGPEPMPVHDGYVRIGSWDLEKLGSREKAPYVFYLARVPLNFDLEDDGRFVRRVTIALQLADEGSHVRALFPEKVHAKGGGTTRFVTRDYLFFARGETNAIRKLELQVEPVVDGSGAGSDRGQWDFSSAGNIGVKRGDRTVFLIVAALPAQTKLEVTATVQIDVGREILGIRYDGLSEISSQTFEIELPTEGGGAPAVAPPAAESRPAAGPRKDGFVLASHASCDKDLAKADIAGLWSSDFGVLEIAQKGSAVTGTYSCCQGTLTGQRRGARLELAWKDAVYGQGWVDFELVSCGEALRGQWGKRADEGSRSAPLGNWNATRPQEESLTGVPSHWRIEGTAGGNGTTHGTAVLYRDEGRVRGKIDGTFTVTFQGETLRRPLVNRLEGTWRADRVDLSFENSLDGSRGYMRLRELPGRLQGSWSTADGASQGQIVFLAAAGEAGKQ